MTPLSYALLGLMQLEPRTGYALRKVFETTPLGTYSSSPGSIYPALKALSPKSRMAVEHGRRSVEAAADWASWARERFIEEER